MNKTNTLLILSLATLLGSAPCLASEPETIQTVAVLGSQPAAPVQVIDSSIQKAIQDLVKQQQKTNVDIRKKIPAKLDNPVGEHPLRNSDKVLILGGAEVMPM